MDENTQTPTDLGVSNVKPVPAELAPETEVEEVETDTDDDPDWCCINCDTEGTEID